MAKIKVAFVQTKPLFGRIKKNVDKAVKEINTLGAGGGVVVLPELFSTGYQFRSKAEALRYSEDARTGYAAARLTEAARLNKIYIVAGIAERWRGRVFNSAVLLGPGGLVGVYRKAHLFWSEKKVFSPGNTPFKVYDIGKARLGMMVCFDWLFPEVTRTLALNGADIICHPSNLVLPYCPEAMITRCIENRVFAVTANRVGKEERVRGNPLRFIGTSQITAPNGKVIYRANTVKEESKAVIIDINEARNKKITPANDIFKDRRTDLFTL